MKRVAKVFLKKSNEKIRYTEKIPESGQIFMDKYPVLPGDIGIFKGVREGDFIQGKFTEICFANPEFLEAKEQRLKKDSFPPGAGVNKFNESRREECGTFLLGSSNIRIRYKRSVCATVELNIALREPVKIKLFTYDMLDLIRSNRLVITSRDKLK